MPPNRLPIVDSDDGVWGDILRQYLMKEHYNDDTDNAANGGHQFVTIRAGTTSAAPLTLTSGSLRTSPAIGSIEFNNDTLYFTQTTGTTRKTIATYNDASGATGDIYYRTSGGEFSRLAVGSTGNVLTVSGGLPSWQAPSTTSTFNDNTFTIRNNTDNTKQLKFDVSNIGTGTTRTWIVPNADTTMVGTSVAQTLTNKRINPRTVSISSTATPAINTDDYDVAIITGLAVNITSFTMSGTPVDGQRLQISITGTAARTIAWGTSFEASTIPLPTTTVTTARLDTYFVWNATTSRWRVADEIPASVYRSGGTDVSVADGGTGRSTNTTAYGIIAAGTSATNAMSTISPGTSGQFLKSAGASAYGAFANITSADVSGLLMKSVRVADVGSETYTISAGSVTQINGTTIDGVTLAIGDRVLIACAPASSGTGSNLSNQPGNGIYTVSGNTTNLTLARAADASGTETPIGVMVYVREGTNSAGYSVACNSPTTGAFTWGTTSSQWNRAYPTISTIQGSAFTLTNKTIALGSNTITGTTAQFNTALTDGDFTTLAGTETLTNKTLTSPKILQILDTTNSAKAVEFATNNATVANYLQIGGSAAADAPWIEAKGSDTNVGIYLTIKGNEAIKVWTYSGNHPRILASGQDTNLDLRLESKGTGTVKANGNPVISTVTAIPAVTGTPSSSTYLRGDGTWATVSGSGDASTNTATSVDSEVVLFSGTGGKTLKRATTTGIAKLTSGVLSAATAGTDYVTPTGSETLTNKTLTEPRINRILDSNGAWILDTSATASAVNYLQIQNKATGGNPSISVLGSDSNISLTLIPKGTGAVNIYSSTGNTPALQAAGADTNHNLNLVPKGTGVVQANGVEVATISGAQTLTNKTLTNPKVNELHGTGGSKVFELSEGSGTPVNYMYVESRQTGDSPVFGVDGTDTNLDVVFVPKGNGGLRLWANTGNPSTISASGPDTNINLDLNTIGTGRVRSNGVNIPTVSSTDTLTNKTLTAPRIANAGFIADANGNEQIIFNTTASAVNEITVTNAATGNGPRIEATGGDTNIPLNLYPKGDEGVYLRDKNGAVKFATSSGTVASAVNFVYVQNGATGNGASLGVWGTDTNVGLNIQTKGTGGVTVQDGNSATLLDLQAANTSPVNYPFAKSNSTGNAVQIGAWGSDTNIDLDFITKGSGVVKANGTPLVTQSNIGVLTPVQAHTRGTETFTISGGNVTQIAGTSIQGGDYTPAVNDRILIVNAPASTGTGSAYNYSTQPANGIYVVTSNTTNLSLSRATDMSGSVNPAGLMVYSEAAVGWVSNSLFAVLTPSAPGSFTYGSGNIVIKPVGGREPSANNIYMSDTTYTYGMWNGSNDTYLQPTNGVSTVLNLPAVGSDTLVARTTLDTLTNKRITKRVSSTASTTSWTIDSDNYDVAVQTALAGNLTVNAPSGTPTQGQQLMIRIKDNNSARTITWNSIFRAIGVTLPTTTVANKTVYVGCMYNTTDTKWDVIAVGQEA